MPSVTVVVEVTKIVVPEPIVSPASGHVTGGGWIPSPPGAYAADPALEGKASFAFVARIGKDAGAPTGYLEFHLNAAKLRFQATGYESLTVNGNRATLQGAGTLKGPGALKVGGPKSGNGQQGFGFLITIVDGQLDGTGDPDRVRFKIWALDDEQDILYDSQTGDTDGADPTIALGGGSITIHGGE